MKVLVMPGDGIGPEIMDETVKVLQALERHGVRFEWTHGLVGGAAYEAEGDPLPPSSQKLAKECDAILFGSVGDDRYEHLGDKRPGVGLMRLRKDFDLFANFRPVEDVRRSRRRLDAAPGIRQGPRYPDRARTDADLYYGKPRGRELDKNGKRFAYNTMPYHEDEVRRIAHVAFKDRAHAFQESLLRRQGQRAGSDDAVAAKSSPRSARNIPTSRCRTCMWTPPAWRWCATPSNST